MLALAYLNSHFQTGLKNVLDRAVLAHTETHAHAHIPEYAKVDEIPFDFQRRIMSVVVRTPEGKDRIISKGAPEAIFPRCTNFELDGKLFPMDHAAHRGARRRSTSGSAPTASASWPSPARTSSRAASSPATPRPTRKADECDLILNGYVAFLDPPKETATAAIQALQGHGVTVKVVTGDNDLVARKICTEVGLSTEFVLLGSRGREDDRRASSPTPPRRPRSSPASRPPTSSGSSGPCSPASTPSASWATASTTRPRLRAADVGISVDTAVDIAKESADMILLEKSLLVLEEGVLEGRKVFANILKYVRMGASSNFGNMFSVLGASVFVPFLPMAPDPDPGQQPALRHQPDRHPDRRRGPRADREAAPVGHRSSSPASSSSSARAPRSSTTRRTSMMLYVFNCWNVSTPAAAAHSASLFQTGWFVESLLTQTLIIHVIRTNKIPFLQSRPSWPLMVMSVVIMAIGIAIPFTPLGALPRLHAAAAALLAAAGADAALLRGC